MGMLTSAQCGIGVGKGQFTHAPSRGASAGANLEMVSPLSSEEPAQPETRDLESSYYWYKY